MDVVLALYSGWHSATGHAIVVAKNKKHGRQEQQDITDSVMCKWMDGAGSDWQMLLVLFVRELTE